MTVLTSAKFALNTCPEKASLPVKSVQFVRLFAMNVQQNVKNMSMMRIVKDVQNRAEHVPKNVKR